MFQLELLHEIHHRIHQGAEGGIKDHQPHAGHLPLPLLDEGLGPVPAEVHMQRHQIAGHAACEADRLEAAPMQLAHQHHGGHATGDRRIGQFQQLVRGHPQAAGHVVVVVADAEEQGDQQRDRHQHQPGAVGELAIEQHQTHHRGDGRPNPVDQGLAQPALALLLPPMHHHAGLGEGEADEHPHRVEGDQAGHAGVEDHQQQGGAATQGEDAVAEHQPVPQGGQLAGQEAVLGQEGRQAREIGVGGVGGQQQDQQGGQLQHGKQHPIAEDQLAQLIQQRGAILSIHNARVVGQGADPAEHRGQQQHHHGEHLAGIAPLHRPEGRHAVADRLDAGEGCAAGAERPHQQDRSDRHQVTALRLQGRRQQTGLILDTQGGQGAAEGLDGSSHEHHHHHPHEEVGGEAEQLGAGAHPRRLATITSSTATRQRGTR